MIESIASVLKVLLLGIEFLAAIIALLYLPLLKNTYWKWFCYYLIIIFIQELYWYFDFGFLPITQQEYFAFFGIPIQYLFFFWLYALKSLKRKLLFLSFAFIYVVTIIAEASLYTLKYVYSLNSTIGTLLIFILIIMEYVKQIRTDNILSFKTNKMFYINLGIVLFYIGVYPYFAFYDSLSDNKLIDDVYYLYFRTSVCVMYLLFISSFIWGKYPLK